MTIAVHLVVTVTCNLCICVNLFRYEGTRYCVYNYDVPVPVAVAVVVPVPVAVPVPVPVPMPMPGTKKVDITYAHDDHDF